MQIHLSEIFNEEIMRLKRIKDPGWRTIWDHVQDLKKQKVARVKELTHKIKGKTSKIKEIRAAQRDAISEVKNLTGKYRNCKIMLDRRQEEHLAEIKDIKQKEKSFLKTIKEKNKENFRLHQQIENLKNTAAIKQTPDQKLIIKLQNAEAQINILTKKLECAEELKKTSDCLRLQLVMKEKQIQDNNSSIRNKDCAKSSLQTELQKRQQKLDIANETIQQLKDYKQKYKKTWGFRFRRTRIYSCWCKFYDWIMDHMWPKEDWGQ